MLNTSCGGPLCPSPVEYLIVFVSLFLVGCLWTAGTYWYVTARKNGGASDA